MLKRFPNHFFSSLQNTLRRSFFHKVKPEYYSKEVRVDIDKKSLDALTGKLKIHPDFSVIQDFEDKFAL